MRNERNTVFKNTDTHRIVLSIHLYFINIHVYIVFLFGMEMLFTQQTKKNNNVKEWYIIEKLIFQVTDFQTFSVMLFY